MPWPGERWAAQPPCLDYSRQSQTRVGDDVPSRAEFHRVARVYPSGELSVAKVMRNAASRPPAPRYGPRMVTGSSRASQRQTRRVVVARARQPGRHDFVLLTLTSRDVRSDEDMRHHLGKFLQYGRKYVPAWFAWYVWVAEDQARGVLHFHLAVDGIISSDDYNRLRRLWCDTYGMGPGAFDTQRMRGGGKATAAYLCKYLTKGTYGEAFRLDPDGTLQTEPWRVSRHTGKPYVRSRFRGNPSGMSRSARWATAPVVEFGAPLGAFPGLDAWHGVAEFYQSPDDAVLVLGAVLQGTGPPVDDGPHG